MLVKRIHNSRCLWEIRLSAPSLTVGLLPYASLDGRGPTVREGVRQLTLNCKLL